MGLRQGHHGHQKSSTRKTEVMRFGLRKQLLLRIWVVLLLQSSEENHPQYVCCHEFIQSYWNCPFPHETEHGGQPHQNIDDEVSCHRSFYHPSSGICPTNRTLDKVQTNRYKSPTSLWAKWSITRIEYESLKTRFDFLTRSVHSVIPIRNNLGIN